MHAAGHYGQYRVPCNYCHQRFVDEADQVDHMNTVHFRYFTTLRSAFDGQLQIVGRSYEPQEIGSPDELYVKERARIEKMLHAFLHRFNSVIVYFVVFGRFMLYDETGAPDKQVTIPMRTKKYTLWSTVPDVQRVWREANVELNTRVDKLTLQGSGYVLHDLAGIEIHMARVDYAGGGGGDDGAATDLFFVSKFSTSEEDAIVDVKPAEPNGCFFTSVAAAFAPSAEASLEDGEQDVGAVTLDEWCASFAHKYMNTMGYDRPMPIKHIDKFERKHRDALDCAINVYMKGSYSEHGQFAGSVRKRRKWGRKTKGRHFFFPIYASKRRSQAVNVINLLLYRKGAEMHYAYVRDLEKLLHVHNQQKVCPNCLQQVCRDRYETHERVCFSNAAQTVTMPKPDEEGRPPKMSLKIGRKRFKNPIVGFCDFEAANHVKNAANDASDDLLTVEELSGHVSDTHVVAEQPPIAYHMLFVSTEDNRVLYEASFASDDVTELMRRFFEDLDDCYANLSPLLNDMAEKIPRLTEQEARSYFSSPCWICRKPITDEDEENGDDRVLDHAHSSLNFGRFLGPAHRSCNSARQHQTELPIFVHNLQNYDGHFLVSAFKDKVISGKYTIRGLADNNQKFKTLTIDNFCFLDSLQFLAASLDKLTGNLKADGHSFDLLRDYFSYKNISGAASLDLLTRKGVFAYEDVTSLEKLRSQTCLPPEASFYSHLSKSEISAADYEHAKTIFERAKCANMEEYMMLYCKLDVYLLAEIVLNFQHTVYSEVALDISQYISMPHLSYDIMLQSLDEYGTEVELVTDPEMHQMCEAGLRGGVAQVSRRYVKLDEPVDKSKPPTLLYTDVVNLYGKCMMDYLPVGGYSWIEEGEIANIDWLQQQDDQEYGYICEVDLDYPEEKHWEHDG